ncbi:hypothetical protein BJ742DRAFT_784288 [Cladochytrium replicatum]|nr:hypothetical protein BJ742DRAFT_784288 [Cladochytrium replicatum]
MPELHFVHQPVAAEEAQNSTSISATQDLLKVFQLSGLYDKYVRPFQRPSNKPDATTATLPTSNITHASTTITPASDPASAKAMDPTCNEYLKGLNGKISWRVDKSLRDTVLAPPKGANVPIAPLDPDTLEAAFTFQYSGRKLEGHDISLLVADAGLDDPKTIASVSSQQPKAPSQEAPSAPSTPAAASHPDKPAEPKKILLRLGPSSSAGSARPLSATGTPGTTGDEKEPKKKKKKRKHEGNEGEHTGDPDGSEKKKKKKEKKHKEKDSVIHID